MSDFTRYKNNEKIEAYIDPQSMYRKISGTSSMEEHPSGKWVLYSEAKKALQQALESHPDYQIKKLQKQLLSVQMGECIECGMKIKEYKPAFGALWPEIVETMKERGLDPYSGHRQDCGLK